MNDSNSEVSCLRLQHAWVRFLVLAIAMLTATLSTVAAPLQVALQEDQIVVSGLPPGGAVALCAIATIPRPLFPGGASYSAVLVDDDSDGRVVFMPESDVPWRSVWAVVELSTGEYVVATPDGFPRRAMPIPGNVVRPGNLGQMNRWWHERAVLKLLVVRPGSGAWTFTANKGAFGDDEKSHRPGFPTSLEHFRAITGDDPPPHNFRRGDVIVALDPINLEYYALTLGNVGE